ncbi:NAD-P-binding protein [Gloeopeniophorella convolvens]|nr:NAD-P-binding protein [Gloeopeniophorella convolvens]
MEQHVGFDEQLSVTEHHDVYPTIDPTDAFANKTYKGKVVLVTGASRGIGQAIAAAYAKAGASLTITGRSQATLDASAAAILADAPGAQVLAVPADVRDPKATEAAVQATLARFGRLDVVIANAGATTNLTQLLGDKDPEGWWKTFEVNLRGLFNITRAALPALTETGGRIVVISAGLAQIRLPRVSDYCISKHAMLRLAEFIALEYPKVKVFSVHPGVILTQMTEDAGYKPSPGFTLDTMELPAATMLYLTAGHMDWLNGRYLSANWDLGEVEREWKEKVIAQNGLVSKLYIPK